MRLSELVFRNGFNATHTCGRSRATHAPNTWVRRHKMAAKLRALRKQGVVAPTELRKPEPAPRRLAELYKPGLRRPAVLRTQAVPCTPAGAPERGLLPHRQVPLNQPPMH